MKKDKILLLYADATQTLPVARSLHKKGFFLAGVYASRLSYGYPSRFISKRYHFADVENSQTYYHFVRQILESEKYVAVIPMNDDAAVMLSKYLNELRQFTAFVMPDYETFSRAYDKHSLMHLCQEKRYPHPKTTIVEDGHIEQIDVDSLQFPLLIKPNFTCGARGMTYCEDKNELLSKFPSIYQEYGDCHLQSYISVGGHQVTY